MKIVVLQENLTAALTTLQRAIPSKPQLPILTSVLLTVQNGSCTLAATDLYFGIKTHLQAHIETEGTITIPGKLFKELITSLKPGQLTLEFSEGSLRVTSHATTTTLQCPISDEYPPFPEVQGTPYELPLTALAAIEQYVSYSVSLDPTRPVLTTVLFRGLENESGVEVVGTDGFRLSTLTLDAVLAGFSGRFLIPAKALIEVNRIAGQLKVDQLSFQLAEELKQLLFSIEGTEIYVRLIEGEYPPYEKIIPTNFTTEVLIDGGLLIEEIKRALIFARDASNIVRWRLTEDQLTITAASPAFGTYTSTLPVQFLVGTGGDIAFNARYVLDFLTNSKAETVWFGMSESLKPALFRPEGMHHQRYVVMPFRVNE